MKDSVAPALSSSAPVETSHQRDVARPRLARIFGVAALLALASYCLAVWFDLLPWLRGWKIYPEGWTSSLYSLRSPSLLVPVVLAIAGVWVAVLLAESSRAVRMGRVVTPLFLMALIILGYVMQLGFLGAKAENALTLLTWRVDSRVFTSYFTLASNTTDIDTFFSKYPAVFNTKLCPHCHDHPPGPALFYWLNLQAVTALPEGAQHRLASEARTLLGSGDVASGLKADLDDTDLLGAILGGSLVLLLANAFVVPLFGLAKLLGPPHYQYRLAALGLALPALLLLAPEFDQFYALISTTALYFGLRGLRAESPQASVLWAGAAGLVVAFGLYFSWALGILLAILGVFGIVAALASRSMLFPMLSEPSRLAWPRLLACMVALALGAVVPLVLLVLATQVDLLFIQRYNLWNAARAEADRPYLVWLFYGPLEFFQLLGLPLAAASLVSILVPVKTHAQQPDDEGPSAVPWYRRLNTYAIIFWLVILGLDLAGRSKAEQGRLFIFIMPLALMGVFYWTGRRLPGRGYFTILFFAQMLVCVVIGARWAVG